MEVMFYIIAGKFNPSNNDFPVKTLITKDKFANKYAQDCTNLLDQQDIFKIIDKIMSAITNGIEGVADDVMTNNVDKVTDITWYVML